MNDNKDRTKKRLQQVWKTGTAGILAVILAGTGTGTVAGLSASPRAFAAESFGAQAGPNAATSVYAVRGVSNGDQTLSAANANRYETEHFQILWGNGGQHDKVTPELLQESGRTLETALAFYMDGLSMQPSFASLNPTGDPGKAYKINLVVMETGLPLYEQGWAYAGIDSEGYPYLMTAPDAMTGDLVLPHELGHVVQFAHGGNSWQNNLFLGPWYEPAANWFREEYIASAAYKRITQQGQAGTQGEPELTAPYLSAFSLTAVNGRAYYEAWPFLKYLEENPDRLPGYGTGFIAELMKSGNSQNKQESVYELIARVNPRTDIRDTIGRYAARMATFDFREKQRYNEQVNRLLQTGGLYEQQMYTMLNAVSGQAGTYEVPAERAPQAAGFNIVPLDAKIPAGRFSVKVKARLDGLVRTEGAGWKAYLIVENAKGVSRYSKAFGSGGSVEQTVFAGEKAYISVAAAPTLSTMAKSKIGIASWNEAFSETNRPFESKPRYAYRLKLDNAQPKTPQIPVDAHISGHRHVNGGGFVADSAHVEAGAYVAKNARVLDNAVVSGTVRIENEAVVRGDARIGGNARMTGHALLQGNAAVGGSALLSGYAIVGESASVADRAIIGGQAIVRGEATVSGSGQVLESAQVSGFYSVGGHATVKGMSIVQGGTSKSDHGGASGNAVAYGDFFEDTGYTIVDGAFSGYQSVEASVNTFKDGYAIKKDNGYGRTPSKR